MLGCVYIASQSYVISRLSELMDVSIIISSLKALHVLNLMSFVEPLLEIVMACLCIALSGNITLTIGQLTVS